VSERESLFAPRRWMRLMRQKWWWKRTFYWPTKRASHRLRYGVDVPPSMLAQLGRGKFVDVVQRGPYTEITEHRTGDMIRMIPFQPNHGFMVELHTADGRVPWRTHLSFDALRKMGIGES
jgi:hypothetical protein